MGNSNENPKNKKTSAKGSKTRKTGSKNTYKSGKSEAWRDETRSEHVEAASDAIRRDKQKSVNHDYMWNADPNLFEMATRVGFTYRLGDPIPFGDGSVRLPGVVGIKYIPTFGNLQNELSPANVAAQYLMTAMRTAVRGTVMNFDQTDVMGYYLAGDSIAQAICWVQRALNVIGYYSASNRYMPIGLLKAMGVAWSTAEIRNLASSIMRLNVIIRKFDALYLPQVFTLIERHCRMINSVFTDENNEFAQEYVFSPEFLYKWAYDKDAKLTLSGIDWAHTPKPIAVYIDILEGMVDALYGSLTDVVTLASSLANTLGPAGQLKFETMLPTSGQIIAGSDYKIMNYIHNADVVTLYDTNGMTIEANGITVKYEQVLDEQDNVIKAWLYQNLYTHGNYVPTAFRDSNYRMIDIHGDPNDRNLIMAATRAKIGSIELVDEEKNLYKLSNYGTEVITKVSIICMDEDDTPTEYEWYPIRFLDNTSVEGNAVQNWLTYNISHMPAAYYEGFPMGSASCVPIWNTDNLTSVSTDHISKMNDTAMLSIFQIGKLNYIR